MLAQIKHIHMVGIGGAGMSAVAHILLELGYEVSGSDITPSSIITRLEDRGANVFIGHYPSNIGNADIVVCSGCIPTHNPEIIMAQERNIPILHRAQMLAELMEGKMSVAVTGMHGKSTTTYLIGSILMEAGLDPSIAIGAEVEELQGNSRLGKGPYFVAEVDESDRSLLYFSPTYSVLTNIEKEHLDCYKNLDDINSTFLQFMQKTKPGGVVFLWGDDRNIKNLLEQYQGRIFTFGLSKNLDIYPEEVEFDGYTSRFHCIYKGSSIGKIYLCLPGIHNVINALGAIGFSLDIGIDFGTIQKVIAQCHGVERRFQVRYQRGGILIVDDYAHHPTEIVATLAAARKGDSRRIIGIFQPHRFTRTKYLLQEFANCFSLVDHLVITDIYPASEEPIEEVSAQGIFEKVRLSGHRSVCFLSKEDIPGYLLGVIQPGDLVITLGAGDINTVATELAQRIDNI